MRRTLIVAAAALSMTLIGQQAFAAAPAGHPIAAQQGSPTVTVGGAVATPETYSAAELAALPQTTLPLSRPGRGTAGSVTGASLEAVVLASAPVLPTGKNTQLRASITVTGDHGRRPVVLALGELDAGFGNHPALLTVDRHGEVDLVIPGDTTRLRSVADVRSISVAVSAAAAVTPTAAGSVQVSIGAHVIDLSAAALARLPRRTLTVSFLAGATSQTHTESGPTLASVLLASHVLPGPNVLVTAVGSDGYGAGVTAGEALLGGRPLLLSLVEDGATLVQPRLIADGDAKGGRDVSGVVALPVVGPPCR